MRSRIDSPATLQVYRFEIPYSAGGRHVIIENATRYIAHVALMACASVAQINANRATTVPPFATTRVDLSPSDLPRTISLYLDPQLYATIPAAAQWIEVRDADPVTPGVSVPVGIEGTVETVGIVNLYNPNFSTVGVQSVTYTVPPGELVRLTSLGYQIYVNDGTADAIVFGRVFIDSTGYLLAGVTVFPGMYGISGNLMLEGDFGPGRTIILRVDNQSLTKTANISITVWGRKFRIS